MIRIDLTLAEILSIILLACVHTGITRQIADSPGNSRPVELIWGIEEVQIPVGKIFNFTIPKDAFAGEIVDIKVTEANQATLPTWLTFDPKSRQFVGWPVLAKDVGAHFISVTVFGASGASVNDVFTLIVRDGDVKPECASEAAQTVLTLLLDLDWDNLTMPEKTGLLGKFSSYMDVQVLEFKVALVAGSGNSALYGSTALAAGPGNANEVKYSGIKLSTVVGCDGSIDGNRKQELTTFVEEAAKDGSMATFTGVDVLGWTLTTARPAPSQRIRRQGNFLNTPEPSPVLPTMAIRPSGDIQPTPYLSVPFGGRPTDHVEPSVLSPWIRPSAALEPTVRPTAVVDDSGLTPELVADHYPVTPTPPMPPPAPWTKKPETDRDSLPGLKLGPNPLELILADNGELFSYKFDQDAWASISGNEHVKLRDADKPAWFKLTKSSNVTSGEVVYALLGLPLVDAEEEKEYHLDVTDGAATLAVPFRIKVQISATIYHHEAEVVLHEDYADFKLERRLKFVSAIKQYYGDKKDYVVLRSVKAGSTIVTWTNGTYKGAKCNDAEFAQIREKLVDANGTGNPAFEAAMATGVDGFKVDSDKVTVRKIGPCAETAKQEAGGEIYLSMIVPIVIVSSLLLIACCIGCILYRKKRRGKMTPEPDQQIFGGKNKPVIFKGEINENGSKGNNGQSKKPAVLADERAAVPPPNYPGRSPTPGDRHQRPANTVTYVDDVDGEREAQQVPLLYLPPAGQDNHPPHLQLVKPSTKK